MIERCESEQAAPSMLRTTNHAHSTITTCLVAFSCLFRVVQMLYWSWLHGLEFMVQILM